MKKKLFNLHSTYHVNWYFIFQNSRASRGQSSIRGSAPSTPRPQEIYCTTFYSLPMALCECTFKKWILLLLLSLSHAFSWPYCRRCVSWFLFLGKGARGHERWLPFLAVNALREVPPEPYAGKHVYWMLAMFTGKGNVAECDVAKQLKMHPLGLHTETVGFVGVGGGVGVWGVEVREGIGGIKCMYCMCRAQYVHNAY